MTPLKSPLVQRGTIAEGGLPVGLDWSETEERTHEKSWMPGL